MADNAQNIYVIYVVQTNKQKIFGKILVWQLEQTHTHLDCSETAKKKAAEDGMRGRMVTLKSNHVTRNIDKIWI